MSLSFPFLYFLKVFHACSTRSDCCNLNLRHAVQYAALLAPNQITHFQIKKRCSAHKTLAMPHHYDLSFASLLQLQIKRIRPHPIDAQVVHYRNLEH
jgi:hypothetical protein